jgi:hypothetical protein
MNKIICFFLSNWVNIISITVGIVGMILAVVFYNKQKKEKRPVYSLRTFYVAGKVTESPNKLEIRYDDKIIDVLCLTKFAFWNAGRETIRREDISVNEPLIIKSAENVKIFDVELAFKTRPNSFEVSKIDEHRISLSFDFIDLNQGVALNIYHNGFSRNDITCEGTLIGAKSIQWGIPTDYIAVRLQPLYDALDYLLKRKNIFVKIMGWIVAVPIFLISLLYMIVLMPNYFYLNVNYKFPKEFNLDGMKPDPKDRNPRGRI